MKRKWVPFIFILVFILTLLPTVTLIANPGNLIKNGDFSGGSSNWVDNGSVSYDGSTVLIGPGENSYIQQNINTTRKDLKLSFDINPSSYGTENGSSLDEGFYAGINFYNNAQSIYFGDGWFYYGEGSFPLNEWTRGVSFYISDAWFNVQGTDLPDFDNIDVWVSIIDGAFGYFDNIKLTYPETETDLEEKVWVRDHEMECFQVWVNEDNNFEFVFWWVYANNNWVQIYDMQGNLVWETDFEKDKPNFEVDLPDGMYTVKTFHEYGHILQEFVIGKP